MSALFRLTALFTSSSPTISTTNARRAGLSNAVAQPPISATASIASTGGCPLNASAASTADWAMAMYCTTMSSRRLSERSAIRPAQAPSTSTGANWQAASTPTAIPLLFVSFRTSRVSAIIVSQLPTCEIS